VWDLFKKNWAGKPLEDPVDIGKKKREKLKISKYKKKLGRETFGGFRGYW
jgi:hypothetical protein